MSINFFFLAKIFILVYVWTLIVFCTLLMFNGYRIFERLKHYEEVFTNKKREAVLYFIPTVLDISRKNKNLQIVLGIRKTALKEFLELTLPLIYNFLSLFLGARFGFSQLTKLLR